jgi:hypothetical protein
LQRLARLMKTNRVHARMVSAFGRIAKTAPPDDGSARRPHGRAHNELSRASVS